MAPKHNFRPSRARATLMAVIAVVSVLALLTTTVSACDCTGGNVIYNGAYCYPSWPPTGTYWTVPVSSYKWGIYCQRQGSCIYGNCWWNKIYYRGSYCYVNDYYLQTGCATRCSNKPIC